MITYILDRMRITLGDSECPLSHKCAGHDVGNDNCVSYRGRTEIGGDRAECYRYFKTMIRAQKQGLISKLAGKVTESLMRFGESTMGGNLEE